MGSLSLKHLLFAMFLTVVTRSQPSEQLRRSNLSGHTDNLRARVTGQFQINNNELTVFKRSLPQNFKIRLRQTNSIVHVTLGKTNKLAAQKMSSISGGGPMDSEA